MRRLALLALLIGLAGCSRTPADDANALFVGSIFDKIHRNLPFAQGEPFDDAEAPTPPGSPLR
jgi:hypothetical protein